MADMTMMMTLLMLMMMWWWWWWLMLMVLAKLRILRLTRMLLTPTSESEST